MKTIKVIYLVLLLISTSIFSQEKYNKFQDIKQIAQQENKNILIKFSGSDWCIPCIKLQKKVIDDPRFQEFISKNLVYVEADFPRKKGKLTKELVARNKELADNYNQQGIFRTTTSNFAWSAEIGMQFYFSRFKLTPGFRGTFMINDEMVADNAQTPPYWTSAISSAKTRAFMFVLKFE